MAGLIFPHDALRWCSLGANIRQSTDDEYYYLCVDKDMKLFCLIYYSPNKSHRAASWSERIEPIAFQGHTVKSVRLDQLVEQKLQELFPND